MPIHDYSVLKGSPTSGKLSSGQIPHYLIHLDVDGTAWEVAVNIESSDGSEVLYLIEENFTPPDAAALEGLPSGATRLAGLDTNPAIDYVRTEINSSPLLSEQQLTLLPRPGDTAADQLKNAVITYLNQAIADKGGTLYAFGSRYTSGFGIHDIHMNQGNPLNNHGGDNGIWQDGLLVFRVPSADRWSAVFIAFQNESWTTDANGNPA